MAEAREKARLWLKLIAKGEDPRNIERREREAKQLSNDNTFGKAFEEYVADHVKPLRKAADIEREMRKDLLSRWKDKPLSEISRRDVKTMVSAVKKRGPYQAHNVLSHTRTFFNWVIDQDEYGIEASPCDHIKPGTTIGKKKSRQRILSDPELKAFWFATGKLGYPFGTLFRLLLMNGQRRSEIAEASWREFDMKKCILTIPPERFKSDSEHMVPLTGDIMALLDTIPKWNAGDFLFSTTGGRTAINGFSYQKRRLDNIMTGALGDIELKPWVLHDLRRTVKSRLASLKVRDEVSEMIIGHGRKGMQRIYDQYEYIDEMREGLEAWNAKLREIVL